MIDDIEEVKTQIEINALEDAKGASKTKEIVTAAKLCRISECVENPEKLEALSDVDEETVCSNNFIELFFVTSKCIR